MQKLILGSTSIYRQRLLERLGIAFEAKKPLFDEELYKSSKLQPLEMAQTLARLKAESLTQTESHHTTIISSDQLVHFQGQIFGKPGTENKAVEQLQKMQGQTHELITAVCVIHQGRKIEFVNTTTIQLKKLSLQQIKNYVKKDMPLDCAGAYKIEKYGIALIEKIETSDPSAIEGLPLIQLSKILQECGYENFSSTN